MKIQLLHICILCIIVSCNTKTGLTESNPSIMSRQVKIDDSTVYSVLTYLFKHKSVNPFLKYERAVESAQMPFFFEFKNDSLEIVKLDSIFDLNDIVYKSDQKEQFYRFKLEQGKLSNKVIISNDSLDLAKNYPYCYVSFPVYNVRKDKFIIRAGYVAGALTAEGATFIYQKSGKDWEIIKILDQVVS